MLSHTLAAMQAAQFAESTAAQSTAVIEAARLAKYSLSAAIAAMQGNAPLPNPDVIAQDHKSWTETAKQMGITKKSSNRPRPAEESGLTARSIGIVKGKHHYIHNDPYAGGERSGKRVKPDAPSTANTAPLVESTPSITLLGPVIPAQADMFVPPPPCAPRIAPPGPAIPAQADVFVPPPTCTPGIAPLGPAFNTLLEALAFYAAAPPIKFTTST
jgi:hypothetical protein